MLEHSRNATIAVFNEKYIESINSFSDDYLALTVSIEPLRAGYASFIVLNLGRFKAPAPGK